MMALHPDMMKILKLKTRQDLNREFGKPDIKDKDNL